MSARRAPVSTNATRTCGGPTGKRVPGSTRPCSNACCRRSGAGSPPAATARPWTKKAGPLVGPALVDAHALAAGLRLAVPVPATALALVVALVVVAFVAGLALVSAVRSEEHTSELQSLMRISYAV